ncbi:MAG: NADH-quinone oxidoreductase subunit C [Chloroflexi bacterium]|nr:NADH-quinone oxidoreductase subunit C [Chloroflexota bacterium]
MTRTLAGADVARRINTDLPGAVVRSSGGDVWVELASITNVAEFLRDTEGLEFSFLSSITAVDYVEYFELVYHLTSLTRNQSIVLKAHCYGRDDLSAPSVCGVWRGADFQEREVWDLFGIRFDGHPNLKRILLWEGFPGHPLRKDFLGQDP